MPKLIRHGCFETNSSSAHSISISSQNGRDVIVDTIYPDENGVVTIQSQDFGWDWFKHNDPETKAAYAFMQFAENEKMRKLVSDIIKEQTGCEQVVFVNDPGNHIDHQSTIREREFIYTQQALKDFIFNKNSWLFGGNDNQSPSPEFRAVPVYKVVGDKVVVVKPKITHTVKTDLSGFPPIDFFDNNITKEEVLDGVSSQIDYLSRVRDDYFFEKTEYGYEAEPQKNYEKKHLEYDENTKIGVMYFSRINIGYEESKKKENQISYEFKIVPAEKLCEISKW